jgi:hypothetical protein
VWEGSQGRKVAVSLSMERQLCRNAEGSLSVEGSDGRNAKIT